MTEEVDNKSYDTVCKDCFFAEYDGNTQVGCRSGRLDKFKNAGAKVVECEDEEKEFYVIKNRICNYMRPTSWDGGEVPIIKAFSESFIRFTILIYCDDNVGINDVIRTMDSLHAIDQGPKRPHIRFIINNNMRPSQLIKEIDKRYVDENNKHYYKWNIDCVDEDEKSVAIDISFKKIKTQYFMICDGGFLFDKNIFEIVDDYINEKMQRFLVANGDGFQLIQTRIFQLLECNQDRPFIEKIEEMAKQYDNEYLIKDFSEICTATLV